MTNSTNTMGKERVTVRMPSKVSKDISAALDRMTDDMVKSIIAESRKLCHGVEMSARECAEKLCGLMERYVDLGLPSGTLWADRNHGAKDGFSGSFPQQWQNIRMEDTSVFPSSEDFQELMDHTDHKFVTNYMKSGASGMVFRSRVNGNEIFLPACGLYNMATETTDHKLSGHYYTKTPCERDQSRYNTLYFNSSMIGAYVDISKRYSSQLRTVIKNKGE